MTFRNLLRRNLKDEHGSFSVEAILMFPLLAWAFMAMFVFFEGLRESNIHLKSTYTVSDLLSREYDELVSMDQLNGMHAVYTWLSRSPQPVEMRVTVVRYDDHGDTDPDTGSHNLVWSRGIAGQVDLVQEEIASVITPHVPIMANASIAIVVETWATYVPLMDMGLQDTDIHNIVVTSPRFTGELMLEGMGDGTGDTHVDGTGDGEDTDVGT